VHELAKDIEALKMIVEAKQEAAYLRQAAKE